MKDMVILFYDPQYQWSLWSLSNGSSEYNFERAADTFFHFLLSGLKCNYYYLDNVDQATRPVGENPSTRSGYFSTKLNQSPRLTHFPFYLWISHWIEAGHLLDSLWHGKITWFKNMPPPKKGHALVSSARVSLKIFSQSQTFSKQPGKANTC